MRIKKNIAILVLFLLVIPLVFSIGLRVVYNPFIGNLDYVSDGNFSDDTLTASNITLNPNCANGEILKWSDGVGKCGTDLSAGGGAALWDTVASYVQLNQTRTGDVGNVNITGNLLVEGIIERGPLGCGNITGATSDLCELVDTNTTNTDTNASNCADGEYLDGSGYCNDLNSTIITLDTNESIFVANITSLNCTSATDKVVGFYLNGTVICTVDINTEKKADDDYLYNDSDTIYFNSSKLSSVYYNVTSAAFITGTLDGGTLNKTQHPDGNYDGITFNFSEASGSPGLDIRMNFTNIPDFNKGIIRYKTDSGMAGDAPVIQVWDYEDNDWEDYPNVVESETFKTIDQAVFDSTDHIQNNTVQMRIYKASNGNTGNSYYIDWVAIVDGFGTPSGEEVDPVWVGDKSNYYNQSFVFNKTELTISNCTSDTEKGVGFYENGTIICVNDINTDTNASTACSGSDVLNGDGLCVPNTNTTNQIFGVVNNNTFPQLGSVVTNITNHENTYKHGNTTPEIFGVCDNGTFVSDGDANKTLSAYQNITNLPVCSANDFITYDGTDMTCDTPTGGGGGGDKWTDNGTWIAPNGTYAPNIKIAGYANITDQLYADGLVGNNTHRYTWEQLNTTSAGISDTDTNVSTACSDNEVLLGQDNVKTCVDLNGTISALDTDTNETATILNMTSLNCTGTDKAVGRYINGTIVCSPDVDTDTNTDTNASTACSNSQVLTGDGLCLNNTNTTGQIQDLFSAGSNLTYSAGVFALDAANFITHLATLFIELTDTFGGDVSGTYDALLVVDTQGLAASNITSGELEDARVSDSITIDSGGSVDSTALNDGGTIGFTWIDAEVADDLTIVSTKSMNTTGNFKVNENFNVTASNGNTDIGGNVTIAGLNIAKVNSTHWKIYG